MLPGYWYSTILPWQKNGKTEAVLNKTRISVPNPKEETEKESVGRETGLWMSAMRADAAHRSTWVYSLTSPCTDEPKNHTSEKPLNQ